MQRTAEVPDAHVRHLADQFLDAAELLLKHVPGVNAPSPIRVNAAFAIELYIKSLNSRWRVGDSYSPVTTESNVRGHKLDKLFEELPENFRDDMASKFPEVPQLLKLYSATFEIERYGFEGRERPYASRTVNEIVELARMFRAYVDSLPTLRY